MLSQSQQRRNVDLKIKVPILHKWNQIQVNCYLAIYASPQAPHLATLKST